MDKLDIDIKYAENDDLLWLKKHDNNISEQILRNKIKNNEIYVAKNNEKIIGWLRYNLFWDNIPFLNMIYILEDYWKMGIGKKLVKYWENEMEGNGYKNVLTSTQSNEEAQHFYRKIGYKEIGGFKYFNDPFEIIFQKIF
jgi:ribosomal protein S18 acetylase RimI-like enzyme